MTGQDSSHQLCWFCGKWQVRANLFSGGCIGQIVCSTTLYMSLEELEREIRFQDRNPRAAVHSREDRPAICRRCLDLYSAQCGDLDQTYFATMDELSDKMVGDILDVEMGMVPFKDRMYHLGCWFCQLPDVPARQKFWSLPLAALFERGWRLRGAVRFGRPELEDFFGRFGDPSLPASPEFIEHVKEHILVDDPQLLDSFAGVRACVFDVSVKDTLFLIRCHHRREADAAFGAARYLDAVRHYRAVGEQRLDRGEIARLRAAEREALGN